MVAAGVGVIAAQRGCVLRRDNEAVAFVCDEVADDLLAGSLGVVDGGVEEVGAELHVALKDAARLPGRCGGSERHRSQAELGDAQACLSQPQVPHRASSVCAFSDGSRSASSSGSPVEPPKRTVASCMSASFAVRRE